MSTYQEVHKNKTNLILHLIAVPLFILGHAGLFILLYTHNLAAILISICLIITSLILQAKGHKLEHKSPEAFTSPGNFVKRIYKEQFITFPMFIFSSGFKESWRNEH